MIAILNSRRLAASLATLAIASLATAGAVNASQRLSIQASAAGSANWSCTVPLNVTCTVTSQKGIQSVKVTANGPTGVVNLFNKSYVSCPKRVSVTYDSAVAASAHQVVECGMGKLTN